MAKKASVLLLKPLPPKGNAGDVIEVKIHFAQHVLIPQWIAVFNTKQVQNQRSAQMKQIAKNKADINASAMHMLEEVKKANGITFTKAVTETGGLYDSVTSKSIATHIEETYNVSISSEHYVLENKIEALGEYEVSFNFHDLSEKFPVHVVAQA